MEFDNEFEVPAPLDQAWDILMDIQRIAPCVPGAELTEVVDDKTYKGKISVKLGPVALTFNGQTTFEELDAENYSAKLKAQGTDSKGRGGAHANVAFRMESSDNGTKVIIDTSLQLSGAVAQYGRGVGMVKDLSQQIIGQFAENLKNNVIDAETDAEKEIDFYGLTFANTMAMNRSTFCLIKILSKIIDLENYEIHLYVD